MTTQTSSPAIRVTETTGYNAGDEFLWCANCAQNLVQVDDDHVAVSDCATIEDASMPAVPVSAEQLDRGDRCEWTYCSGIWDGERWVYDD